MKYCRRKNTAVLDCSFGRFFFCRENTADAQSPQKSMKEAVKAEKEKFAADVFVPWAYRYFVKSYCVLSCKVRKKDNFSCFGSSFMIISNFNAWDLALTA